MADLIDHYSLSTYAVDKNSAVIILQRHNCLFLFILYSLGGAVLVVVYWGNTRWEELTVFVQSQLFLAVD